MRSSHFLVCFALLAACGNDRPRPDGGPRTDGGGMDSNVPACAIRGPEDTVAACSDGCDNEDPADGFVDCDDRGCCSVRSDCPAESYCGRLGDAGPPRDAQMAMPCAVTGPEDTIAACSNGCNDDPASDGFADCDDFDCCDLVTCGPDTGCGRASMRDAGMIMRCDGGGSIENTAALCGNGMDDDCDGFADCEDFGCCSRVSCGPDTACGRRPDGGPRPDAGSTACAERGAENTLAACSNGCDDDGNTFFDCGDRGCCLVRTAGGSPCGAGTYCATYDPGTVNLCPGDDVTMPPAREATLAACSNGCDDDRNGFEDCSDRGCCLIRTAGGSPCGVGTYCADTFVPGTINLCPGDDVTMAPDPEADATACGNSCDDDRDGYEDCEDRDCCAVRTDCPATTYCGRP